MSRSREFFQAMRDMLPLLVGAMPFGIIYGTLAASAGLSAAQAIGMSLLVFAGSAQFIALSLLSGGAGMAVVLLTTLVVNLRHALYSATLQPFVRHLPARWRVPLAFWLTDEAFAVVPMIAMQEMGIDHARVNVNGGATALGHPIGASGARILTTLIAALKGRGKSKGMASLCIGGGEAVALAVELA